MFKWRKLYLIILAIGLSTWGIAQQSCVEPNPSAHIILIPAGLPKLDGQALPKGSIISLVFESGDTLRCAGQVSWQDKSTILQAYGATPEGDAGYKANEILKFRIILPNGCMIEDDLITTKFQGVDNNQNPGFQNLAIDRLEQLDAISPQFNFTLPATDSIGCNQTQIEINPQVDIIGAKFQWSTDSLGVISTRSKLTVETAGIYHLSISYGGCKKSQSIEIKDLRIIPEINFNPSSPQICQGETARIEVSTNVKTASFLWSTGAKSNFITATKGGRYSVVVSTPSGCTNEKGLDLVINPRPVLELGANKEVCTGDSVRLETPLNINFAYAWNTGDTSHFITVKQSGWYKLQIKDGNNCGNVDSVQVNFVDAPQLTLPSSSKLCFGDSLILKANSNATLFRWSTGASTSGITVYKAGIYQLQASNNAGCKISASTEVITTALPSSSLPVEINRCLNEAPILNPNAGAVKYRWNSGDTSATLVPKKSGLYIVTITNSAGCSIQDSSTVNFLPAPIVELGQNVSLCNGEIAKLSVVDSAGYRYRWSTEEKLPSIETVKSGLYSVTVSNIANCQTIDSVQISFKAAPQRILPKIINDCELETKKIVAGINQLRYQWSTGEATASIIPRKSGLYTVTISTEEGCTAFDSTNVTLAANPKVNLPDKLILCPESPLTLDVSASGSSYQWSNGASTGRIEIRQAMRISVQVSNTQGCSASDSVLIENKPQIPRTWPNPLTACIGSFIQADASALGKKIKWNTGDTLPKIQIKTAGKYSLTFLDSYGCLSHDSLNAIFYNAPNPQLPDTIKICSGGTAKLDVGNVGKTYEWNTGARTVSINVKDAAVYRVVVTNEYGCKTTDSTRLLVQKNPVIDLSPQDTICPGESLVLDVRSFGQSFKWSTGSTAGLITVANAGLYQVTVTDRNGCTGQGSSRLSITNFPVAQIEGSKNFICPGDSLTLNGKGANPLSWLDPSHSGKLLSKSQLQVFPKGQSTYGYIVQNLCGTDTAFVNIGIYKVNGVASKDTAILAGRKIKLQATGGKSYQWSTPELELDDATSAAIEVSPKDSTYFVVAIKDLNNCVLMDTVFVGVYSQVSELVKPINLFTPNGDGKNDALKFNDLNLFLRNRLTVFNRWGVVVFRQANYQNDWDGTYQGQLLPAGVYYYTLELDEVVLKSSLTLIRN